MINNQKPLLDLLVHSSEIERVVLTQIAIRSLTDFIVVYVDGSEVTTFCIFKTMNEAMDFCNNRDGDLRLFTIMGFLSFLFQQTPSLYQQYSDLEGILGYALLYGGEYEYKVE